MDPKIEDAWFGFSNVLGSLCVIFIGFSNVLGSLCVIFIGFSNVSGSLCITFIGFSNVLGSRCALLIVFSNVSVFWKPKTLEKPIKTIKTIKTIIFKLSPDGGVAPGDSLKIMVFMVFIGFSNVLGSLCVIFIGFSNVSVFWKPKTLEKPIKTIKTIIFKPSPDGGVAPGDSLKIMVFIGFSNVLGSLCVIFIGFSNVLSSLCVICIVFSNVLGSLCVIFIGFSNVLGS